MLTMTPMTGEIPTAYPEQSVTAFTIRKNRTVALEPGLIPDDRSFLPGLHRKLRAFGFTTQSDFPVGRYFVPMAVFDGDRLIAVVAKRRLSEKRKLIAHEGNMFKFYRSWGVPLLVIRDERDGDACRYVLQIIRQRARKEAKS